MKTLLKIDKRHKKDILRICKQYDLLNRERIIKITPPSRPIKVSIKWESDEAVTVEEGSLSYFDFSKSKEIVKINKQIKDFCTMTRKWGEKHFNDKFWLWDNIFWEYPLGGRFDQYFEVKWI